LVELHPWESTIVQTFPRPAADPATSPPHPARRAIVIPRRLDGSSTGSGPEISRLVLRRPTVTSPAVVDVDVVIVSHRCSDRVQACLDRLAAGADGAVLSVTVVDNGSNDGTYEAVSARRDGTRVLDMETNAGLATAANAGMARGRGRYILILDPDMMLPPGSVRTLVDFADRHPEAGVIAPRLVTAGAPAPTTDQPDDAALELDCVSGRAMLVPRVVHAATAGFDEGYFSSWANADWCRRIKAAGYSIWCVPTATAVHRPPPIPSRSERRGLIRSYYAGAQRYWLHHGAPPRWHPWRWTRAFLLTVRESLSMLSAKELPPARW
jgi:N-acetylglucosaminyl-diphospho-decaprenol L-rhamnosyltransferase